MERGIGGEASRETESPKELLEVGHVGAVLSQAFTALAEALT
jgi:hypothetical protein